MWTIRRYILRQHLGPFLFAFAVIFFILVLDLLLDIMDAVLGKGLGLLTVIELFALNFAWMIAIAVPMAVLVAVLMAFGRLANDNEITALLSSGVSPLSLLAPVAVVAAMVSTALMAFNEFVLPDSNFRAKQLMSTIRRQKPAVSLKDREGEFITDFPGHVLRVDRVRLDSQSPTAPVTGSMLEGILVYELDRTGRDPATIVTARTGSIELWQGGAVVRLVLHDGEMIQIDPDDRSRDLRTTFETQAILIRDRDRIQAASARPSDYRGDRELSSRAMLERVEAYREHVQTGLSRIAQFQADSLMPEVVTENKVDRERRRIRTYDRSINRYLVEVHKKFSIPVSCVVFVIVGVPLGMMARGAGRTVAVVGSLVLFLLYWSSLISGENLADEGHIPPWLAMWSANIVVALLGSLLVLAVSTSARAGGLPELLPRLIEAWKSRNRQDDTTSGATPRHDAGAGVSTTTIELE